MAFSRAWLLCISFQLWVCWLFRRLLGSFLPYRLFLSCARFCLTLFIFGFSLALAFLRLNCLLRCLCCFWRTQISKTFFCLFQCLTIYCVRRLHLLFSMRQSARFFSCQCVFFLNSFPWCCRLTAVHFQPDVGGVLRREHRDFVWQTRHVEYTFGLFNPLCRRQSIVDQNQQLADIFRNRIRFVQCAQRRIVFLRRLLLRFIWSSASARPGSLLGSS